MALRDAVITVCRMLARNGSEIKALSRIMIPSFTSA